MAIAPENSSATAPAGEVKSPPGQISRVAGALAAKHGSSATGPSARPVGLPPRTNGPGSKGGRRDFQTELSDYLAQHGAQVVPMQTAGDPAFAPQPAPYLVTPEFIGEVVKTLATGIESYDVANTTRRVKVLCGDANLAKEIGESFSAPPGCIDTLEKAFTELARKYPAILQWGPEGAALGCLAAWFAKRSSGNKKLQELEALVKEQAQARATAASVSPKTP